MDDRELSERLERIEQLMPLVYEILLLAREIITVQRIRFKDTYDENNILKDNSNENKAQ